MSDEDSESYDDQKKRTPLCQSLPRPLLPHHQATMPQRAQFAYLGSPHRHPPSQGGCDKSQDRLYQG